MIEKFASVYMRISDMAVLLELDEDRLRHDIRIKSSPVGIAYRKGKATSKLNLRAQEMKLAKVGSPLALENAQRNLLDMEDDE